MRVGYQRGRHRHPPSELRTFSTTRRPPQPGFSPVPMPPHCRDKTLAMHRFALVVALVSLIILGVGAIVAPAAAQDNSPSAGTAATTNVEETQAVIDGYLAALVAREDIAPFFSDDKVRGTSDASLASLPKQGPLRYAPVCRKTIER